MSYWHEKAAIVTGASSGLGLAIATALVEQGAHVAVAARGVEALDEAAARLRAAGGRVLAIPTDVTRQEAVDALVARTVAEFGRLDALVNNAGQSMRGAVLDTTPDDFARLIELNLLSVVRCTRAAMPHLLARRGHVVNIGSLAGKSAARYMGAYCASKFALSAYSQQLRLELAPRGLHVLLVSPGPIARDAPRRTSEPPRGPGAADAARGGPAEPLPASAYQPGAGVKTSAIPPARLAALILRACQRRRSEIVVPRAARLLFALAQLSPRLGDYLVRKMT